MGRENRYQKLLSTTLILSIGTILSKLMTYVVLTPLYTDTLDPKEFGFVELVVQTANLLMPLVSLGINQAVLRFGMDGETDRGSVLTTGLVVNLAGFLLFVLFYPLVRLIPTFGDYALLTYFFVFSSITHYLFAYSVKSMHKATLFTICVIIGTVITVVLDILFLKMWDMGVTGYILAIALSDLTCSVILVFSAKLHRYIRLRKLKKSVVKAMLKYSVPLIPNSALWWLTDYSDRFMLSLYDESTGLATTGLYSLAYRLPNMLIMVCGIFMDAWQMSVLSEKSRLERQKFFSNVFQMYQAIIFVGASGLILCSKLITYIMAQDAAYYPSWQYIPTLVFATAMSCFVTFLGSVYIVEKKSKSSLVTTGIGTVLNIGANAVLIPLMGAHGAAIATALSYGFVFVLRAFHTRRFIPIDWDLPRLCVNLSLITAQCFVMVFAVPGWESIVGGMFAVVLVINFRLLLGSVKQLILRRKGG